MGVGVGRRRGVGGVRSGGDELEAAPTAHASLSTNQIPAKISAIQFIPDQSEGV